MKVFDAEELQARGILDNDELYNGPAERADASQFLEDAKELAKAANSAAEGYAFTNNGALVFLCWAFYQLGVWKGCEEYRGYLIEGLKYESEAAGAKLPRIPEDVKDIPFEMNDGGVAGIVAALDDGNTADKILSLFRLDIWDDDGDAGEE